MALKVPMKGTGGVWVHVGGLCRSGVRHSAVRRTWRSGAEVRCRVTEDRWRVMRVLKRGKETAV